jgi:hypothetical protein
MMIHFIDQSKQNAQFKFAVSIRTQQSFWLSVTMITIVVAQQHNTMMKEKCDHRIRPYHLLLTLFEANPARLSNRTSSGSAGCDTGCIAG